MSPLHVDRIVTILSVLSLSYTAVTNAARTCDTMAQIKRDHLLSSPRECARPCLENEPSKTCYYHFTVELYTVLGEACSQCIPNNTDVSNMCQCVLADGFEKSILTVNRQLPGSSIQVCQGDKVVVDVENHMEGMELTIHWHGLFQKKTPYYDGVPLLTQCSIPQGTTFRYQYHADNVGTHFWHSHNGLQKLDGLSGSLIVRQPPNKDPHHKLYDYDLMAHVMFINDWLHEQATTRFPGLLRRSVAQDAEAVLINGMGQYEDPNTGNRSNTPLAVFTIDSAKKYRFRMINAFATNCPAQLTIQGHILTVIASDGQPVVPTSVTTIISLSGERYDFVIHANQPPSAYWIQVRALGDCGNTRVQQIGVLHYTGTPDKPSTSPPTYDKALPTGVVLNPLDDLYNTSRANAIYVNELRHAGSIDEGILRKRPDTKIILPYHFYFYDPKDVFNRNTYPTFLVPPVLKPTISLIDNFSYQDPSSPPLSQIDDIPPGQFCNSKNRPADCKTPCTCSHTIDIPLNAIVEVILYDKVAQVNLSHPFHLHGFAYHVIGMGQFPVENATDISIDAVRDLDRRGMLNRNYVQPPAKDTVAVPKNGYLIFRFRANNPGYWLLHCHFVYHLVIGMRVVFRVGNFSDLPPVPRNFPVCGNYLPPITDY